MSFIKKFFSKIFVAKSEELTGAVRTNNDEQLKSAARDAVKSAFNHNKPKLNPKEKEKCPAQNSDSKRNTDTKTSSVDFKNPRVLAILAEYNQHFFAAFKLDDSQYKLKTEKQNMIVQIYDKDFSESLSQSNKLSLSYEHIFLRLVQKEFRHFECRISLQAGDSQQQHQKNIQSLAHKLASRVRKSGQKVTVPAKSSYERSIIHQVVAKFPDLGSKSVGPHHQRRLIIYSLQTRVPTNKPNTQHVNE